MVHRHDEPKQRRIKSEPSKRIEQGGMEMTLERLARAAATVAACAALVLVGTYVSSPHVRADDDDRDSDESKIQRGFEIAPVRLDLHGKNRKLVGLGSYIVNAVADCNGCHTSSPADQYIPSGNPYLLPPVFKGKKKVNAANYLGGGNDFGPLVDGSAHIVSRNLTPDSTGLPEGGHTFEQFRLIMRTGVDFDHLHPTCPPGTVGPHCVPFPFNGALLQIMPWGAFQDMTDHDLRAIYEYLRAVPCVEGPEDPSDPLHNNCH
jgi:hypothetical protein